MRLAPTRNSELAWPGKAPQQGVAPIKDMDMGWDWDTEHGHRTEEASAAGLCILMPPTVASMSRYR